MRKAGEWGQREERWWRVGKDGQTDRQTDRQIDRQTDRQTDR